MKKVLMLMAISFLFLTACTSSEKKAAGLMETAKFEEKQTNREHAVKLYEEITAKYPGTTVAKEAEERLKALKK